MLLPSILSLLHPYKVYGRTSDRKKDIHALLLRRIPFVSEIDEKMACITYYCPFWFLPCAQFSFVSPNARKMVCLFACGTC
ncbi:hypothetical protein EYC80_001265 [Monilinia laxa]|uniref:Uncharacterized protein n=1 Tax=Monilinia laxa TaxID=61186 RepID=A0A5N6K9M5_MONLA|nr:hypothetical protein EYC80_001265 [Monilinia laxa]